MWISVNLVEGMSWREVLAACHFFHFDIYSRQTVMVFHWTVMTRVFLKTITLLFVSKGLSDQYKSILRSLEDFFFSLGNAKGTGLRILCSHPISLICKSVLLFLQSVANFSEFNQRKRDFSHTGLSSSIPIYIGMRRKKITNNTLIISSSSKGLFNLNNLI